MHTIILSGNTGQAQQNAASASKEEKPYQRTYFGNDDPGKVQASTGTTMSKDDYYRRKEARDLEREKTICFNGAYNAAVATVQAALAAGVLDINSQVKKSKAEGSEYSVFKTYVLGLAEELYQTFQNVPQNHHAYMGTEALAEPKETKKVVHL